MTTYSENQLGYFITFDLWQDANKLLQYQLQRKNDPQFPNKHFNTLSMFYYDKLTPQVEQANQKKYYNNKVANSLFYALSNEFGIYPYVQPKSGLALRNYAFLTYPMRCVYYSIGLYLLKVAKNFLEYATALPRVKSFYGGKLAYQNTEIILQPKRVYYRQHYTEFRNAVMNAINEDNQNTVCLSLDVANYFDTIDVSNLLALISSSTNPSSQQRFKFDSHTIEQIQFFFDYISFGNMGILQMDNGIVSDFLGYLYLLFGDIHVNDLLQELISGNNNFYNEEVIDFKVFRYVDDMYLFIELKPELMAKRRDAIVTNIGNKIADMFNEKLSLKCNKKTGYFKLYISQEYEELKKTLKKVSPDEPLPDDDDERSPQERANAIFSELEVLKDSSLDMTFDYSNPSKKRPIAVETLKDVFSETIDQFMYSQENTEKLREILSDFNFDLFRVHPQSLLTIMCRPGLSDIVSQFEEYLLQQSELTNKEIDLILRYLSFKSFSSQKLVKKLKQENNMKVIMEVFEKGKLSPRKTGYFEITSGRILKLKKMKAVIAQIRLRNMAEKKRAYSQALNHLLNEIHGLCYELDTNFTKDVKKYKSDDVTDFLRSINVPESLIFNVGKLFDQRNLSPVSHPGSTSFPALDVSQLTYQEYKQLVSDCMSHIFKS